MTNDPLDSNDRNETGASRAELRAPPRLTLTDHQGPATFGRRALNLTLVAPRRSPPR
jgi:hypothetical protein